MAKGECSGSDEVVSAFLLRCSGGREAFVDGIRSHFVESTRWENVGSNTTIGIDEALAFLEELQASASFGYLSFEILALARVDSHVLTERVDRIIELDGTERAALRNMGIFEVEDGKILAWRNYPSQPDGRSAFEQPASPRL